MQTAPLVIAESVPYSMFLLVVPTIRHSLPQFPEAIERLNASLTLPTALHLLEGSEGKAQTLNAAYDRLLQESTAPIYVTADDDFVPPPGWQDRVAAAFEANPRWGAIGLYLGKSHHAYMGLSDTFRIEAHQGISYIPIQNNLVGCFIAFRRDVALRVGRIPASPQKYQYWEDGWRCQQVCALGYELAYLYDLQNLPELVAYEDPVEYLAAKEADIVASQAFARRALGQSRFRSLWKRLQRG